MTLLILASALCIMLASLVGIIFSERKLKNVLQKNLPFLVTFSTGVFIVLTYSLIEELRHESLPITSTILYMVIGVLVLEVGSRIIPSAHHHHEPVDDHSHSHIDARRMMFGDAIHNVGDGILLVAAFAVDIHFGLATAGAILIHEVVQEISEFFVLREAGYSSTHALLQNFLVSSTILIGVGAGLVIASAPQFTLQLTAFAAGGFLYVICRDLIPNTIDSVRKKGGIKTHTIAILLGIALMITIQILVPHEEPGGPEIDITTLSLRTDTFQ